MKSNRVWYVALVGLILVGLLTWSGCIPKTPGAPGPQSDLGVLGVTHFSGLDVTGVETDELVIDQTSTGDIVEFRDNGTVVWRLADGGAITAVGDQVIQGTTPQLTIGDAGAEDTALVFDGNAQDFYVGLDDSADDLLIGLGATVGTTGIIYLDENQDVGLGGASAGAKLDVTGNVLIDGSADEEQLVVQSYTTQTNKAFVVETSAGTDMFWITGDGDAELNGTTPTLTLGDAGEEDTGLALDGNAQDFYIAIDDTADDLILGLGLAVGTTGIIYLDENQDVGLGGASAGAKLDVTGNGIYDGAADEVQLTVQGYTTQTNAAFVVEQSDGTDVFTVSNAGAVGIEGDITLQNDETFSNAYNGTITATVAAGGSFLVSTGNLAVGDGTPTNAMNGEDGYVEGFVEIDGLLYADGGAEINGTLTLQNDETIVNSTNGTITVTVDSAGKLALDTGNLYVGDGSTDPSLTLNGEDLYVEGTIEADGNARFDGGLTVGAGDFAISNGLFLWDFADLVVSDGDTITPTVSAYALDTSGNVTITLAAVGTEGQLLVIIGDDANDILIADTNIRTSTGGALTVGQWDVVVFIYQDSEWIELLLIANS